MTTRLEKGITGTLADENWPIPSPPLTPFWEISGLTLDEVSEEMGTITFGISSKDESDERFKAAFGGAKQAPRMNFASVKDLFTIMTAARWELVHAMAGAGAMSIEGLARRIGRDPDDVYNEVRALLNCGVLYSTGEGRVIFPFKAVHIDVMLEAAA